MDIIGHLDLGLDATTKGDWQTASRSLRLAKREVQTLTQMVELLTVRKNELVRALEGLLKRVDGDAVLLDGSNLDTRYEHAVLGHFYEEDE